MRKKTFFENRGERQFIGSILNAIFNYDAGRAQQTMDRQYRAQLMEREDNSVQRRVKDLEAAGLNKVLGAGQGAQAGPVVNVKPPQMNMPNVGLDIMNLMKMKSDISRTEAQKALLVSQKYKTNTDALKNETMIDEMKYNINKAKEIGSTTNYSNKSMGANMYHMWKNFTQKNKLTDLTSNKKSSLDIKDPKVLKKQSLIKKWWDFRSPLEYYRYLRELESRPIDPDDVKKSKKFK